MTVAVFTDNDFDKVNGVTTTLTAVLAHAPVDLRVRIYTAAPHDVDQPQYLGLARRAWWTLPISCSFSRDATCEEVMRGW
jgi:hypothetical protein